MFVWLKWHAQQASPCVPSCELGGNDTKICVFIKKAQYQIVNNWSSEHGLCFSDTIRWLQCQKLWMIWRYDQSLKLQIYMVNLENLLYILLVVLKSFFTWWYVLFFSVYIHYDAHLFQMELKVRLMELNWQKSQYAKIKTTDERTKNDVRVCKVQFISIGCGEKTCCSVLSIALILMFCKFFITPN